MSHWLVSSPSSFPWPSHYTTAPQVLLRLFFTQLSCGVTVLVFPPHPHFSSPPFPVSTPTPLPLGPGSMMNGYRGFRYGSVYVLLWSASSPSYDLSTTGNTENKKNKRDRDTYSGGKVTISSVFTVSRTKREGNRRVVVQDLEIVQDIWVQRVYVGWRGLCASGGWEVTWLSFRSPVGRTKTLID